MNPVVVSKAARTDLIHIRDYIRDELNNPEAAGNVLRQLRSAVESLEHMPERGKPLDALVDVHTDYRYLTCGSYRIFYLYDGSRVEVVRILHTLQSFMRALFPLQINTF